MPHVSPGPVVDVYLYVTGDHWVRRGDGVKGIVVFLHRVSTKKGPTPPFTVDCRSSLSRRSQLKWDSGTYSAFDGHDR